MHRAYSSRFHFVVMVVVFVSIVHLGTTLEWLRFRKDEPIQSLVLDSVTYNPNQHMTNLFRQTRQVNYFAGNPRKFVTRWKLDSWWYWSVIQVGTQSFQVTSQLLSGRGDEYVNWFLDGVDENVAYHVNQADFITKVFLDGSVSKQISIPGLNVQEMNSVAGYSSWAFSTNSQVDSFQIQSINLIKGEIDPNYSVDIECVVRPYLFTDKELLYSIAPCNSMNFSVFQVTQDKLQLLQSVSLPRSPIIPEIYHSSSYVLIDSLLPRTTVYVYHYSRQERRIVSRELPILDINEGKWRIANSDLIYNLLDGELTVLNLTSNETIIHRTDCSDAYLILLSESEYICKTQSKLQLYVGSTIVSEITLSPSSETLTRAVKSGDSVFLQRLRDLEFSELLHLTLLGNSVDNVYLQNIPYVKQRMVVNNHKKYLLLEAGTKYIEYDWKTRLLVDRKICAPYNAELYLSTSLAYNSTSMLFYKRDTVDRTTLEEVDIVTTVAPTSCNFTRALCPVDTSIDVNFLEHIELGDERVFSQPSVDSVCVWNQQSKTILPFYVKALYSLRNHTILYVYDKKRETISLLKLKNSESLIEVANARRNFLKLNVKFLQYSIFNSDVPSDDYAMLVLINSEESLLYRILVNTASMQVRIDEQRVTKSIGSLSLFALGQGNFMALDENRNADIFKVGQLQPDTGPSVNLKLLLPLILIPIVLVVSSAGLLTLILIYYRGQSRKRRQAMEDLNIKLLEYNAPIDPNTYFTKNPMKHSFIIPFENLKIEKRVSEGASGVVFRAIWKTTRTQVAIKLMKIENEHEDIVKEISILSSLRHPNIVLFCGISVDNDGNYYIVNEFVEHGSLDSLLYKGRNTLSFRDKIKILYGISRGMSYLHSMSPQVIHRDLKPNNILIDANLVPKICDFGLAKFIVSDSMTMNMVGTQGYIAPEIIDGDETYSDSVDVYSFGIMMHEMFFEEKPYRPISSSDKKMPLYWGSTFAFGKKVLGGLRPEIPFELNDESGMEEWFSKLHCDKFNYESTKPFFELLCRCWEREPSNRPSFSEICEALEQLL